MTGYIEHCTELDSRIKPGRHRVTMGSNCSTAQSQQFVTAPPQNKPTREEQTQCQPWLRATLELTQAHVYLALGQIAWNGLWDVLHQGMVPRSPRPRFGHGVEIKLARGGWLIGSYHPSQQNTFTGRLTEAMLDDVMDRAKRHLNKARG